MNSLGLALLIAKWIDDSGSMILEENRQRKETLIQLIKEILDIYSMANGPDTHTMRLLNSREPDMKEGEKWEDYLGRHEFGGVTRIGTELKEQILDKFVIGNSSQSKPLLVLILADGAVCLSPEISKAI